jgi:hypothetical protein
MRLLRERKLEDLLDPPRAGAPFEASGVIAIGKHCFIVLDNVRRVARVGLHLRPGSDAHLWVGTKRHGEGYEAITYNAVEGRFYLMIEAQKHPDGTFKGIIEEYDDRWRFRGGRWIDFPFEKRNTGFEGLASMNHGGQHHLLALCEGGNCRGRGKDRNHGRGRILVLELHRRVWRPIARIKLPRSAKFRDYSGMAILGDRLAVVSQESSRIWLGRLRARGWVIAGRGRTYEFPRTKKGKKVYCTVEGISWLTPRTLVAVSDLRKKKHPNRGRKTDQSIHIFSVPRR